MRPSTSRLLRCGAWGIGIGLGAKLLLDQLTGYDFANKVVIVTGGSRGLGLVIARQLAKQGARLAICARDHEELGQAARELRFLGAKVSAQVCDLTNVTQIQMFVENVRKELGPIDVLINNAGVIQVGPIETMTRVDFEQALNVHLWGVIHMVNQVLPDMRARGAGRIVNIASIGGLIAIPHMLPYSTSKFALVGYSQGLRAELADDGIVVTTVCPGLMRTGSHHHALFKGRHRQEFTWFSVGGAIPGLTISAERAASQVIEACRRGRGRVTLSIPARLAVVMDTLAPQLTANLTSLVNRMLPSPGGIGEQQRKGKDSQSEWSPSWLTTLSDRAAGDNNEIPPQVVSVADQLTETRVDEVVEDSFPASDPPSWNSSTSMAAGTPPQS